MQIEKRPVSYAQLIGWSGLAVTQAFLAGVIWATLNSKLDSLESYRVTRSAQTDAKFAEIKTATDAIPTLTYRLGQMEERDTAQDARMDRIVDSFSTKLDILTESVNGLRSDVRVLSSKVEANLAPAEPNVKPTVYRR